MSAQESTLTTDDFDPEIISEGHLAVLNRTSARDVPAKLFRLAWLIIFNYMNGADSVSVRQDALATDLHITVRTLRKWLVMLPPLGLRIEPGNDHNEVRLSISTETTTGGQS